MYPISPSYIDKQLQSISQMFNIFVKNLFFIMKQTSKNMYLNVYIKLPFKYLYVIKVSYFHSIFVFQEFRHACTF